MEVLTFLALKNPHPRDETITFDEGPHVYTIRTVANDGQFKYDTGYTSTTTFVHSHFPKFNPDIAIRKMRGSRNWKKHECFGMTPKQIKKLWSDRGTSASTAGTKMHYDIECFYNDEPRLNDSVEYSYFQKFEADRLAPGGFGEHLKPYRTEWVVYQEDLRLSGSIDMVFEAPDGTLQIYDWKRSKAIKKTNPWSSSMTECIEHLPDSNYWHYALQLNIYKTILETKYGKKVTDLFLVCLHPNNANGSYQLIRVPILKQEMSDLLWGSAPTRRL
jgi:ATP-dependent exoDNAse (exonuclease V) beta subunit